ncbi:hypothetical protein D3C77_538460 [compost metagenome]
MNTESWKNAFKLSLDALTSKTVYSNNEKSQFSGMDDYYRSKPFIMGRAAMSMASEDLFRAIESASASLEEYQPFEIGIVAGPVDPADPNKTNSVHIRDITSIRLGSANVDAAWDFIKFINGEEFAKVKSRTLSNGLLSRVGFTTEMKGISLESFYKLSPKMSTDQGQSPVPRDFHYTFRQIIEEEVNLLEQNKKNIDEALETIQFEGQAALDQAYKDLEDELPGNE